MCARTTSPTPAPAERRTVVAPDDQIEHAWSQLPRLIKRIPPELRDERIVKMCVAVASGLFDAAINYVWNAAIGELREKVRRFGITVVPQVPRRNTGASRLRTNARLCDR